MWPMHADPVCIKMSGWCRWCIFLCWSRKTTFIVCLWNTVVVFRVKAKWPLATYRFSLCQIYSYLQTLTWKNVGKTVSFSIPVNKGKVVICLRRLLYSLKEIHQQYICSQSYTLCTIQYTVKGLYPYGRLCSVCALKDTGCSMIFLPDCHQRAKTCMGQKLP